MSDVGKILAFLKKPNRYRKLDALGEGVAAKVYGVFDTYLRRVVACKQLNREHLSNPDLVQTFINEMVLMGSLSHPGLLSVYDAVLSEEGDPSYIMALAEGKSVDRLMQIDSRSGDGQPLSLAEAVRILAKVSETLTYAHDRGVLHLDMKPENILIGHYGEVVIMDWGAAYVYDKSKYTQTYKAVAGEITVGSLGVENKDLVMGTPMYMSPEQLQGSRDSLTPASDVFSVGIMLYQMLTGHLPFKGDTLKKMVDRICNAEAVPVHEVNADIPLNLSRLCMKMLRKDSSRRYQNFVEVRDAIDDYQRSAVGFPTRIYRAGEVIFREGDPSDYVCILVSGCVVITVASENGEKELARVKVNEPFGELAALTGLTRTATAIAKEESVVRIISRQDIVEEIDKLSPWVGGIVSTLTERLIEMNIRLLEQDKANQN
ncbi:MAG: protein kinase [Gammaproteobacteria bacterium]|nr:protein kinase [Gammaproteobacteria bacterium]